ncbi:MAG: diguanylate cyclase [Pseudomonadota bacterium]
MDTSDWPKTLLNCSASSSTNLKALAFDYLSCAIVVLDHNAKLVAANPPWRALVGANAEVADTCGDDYLAFCCQHLLDDDESQLLLEQEIRGLLSGDVEHFSIEIRTTRGPGTRWYEIVGRRVCEESFRGALVSHSDVSDRRIKEEYALQLAYHDQLTGLANRRRFDETMSQLTAHGCRPATPFTLTLVDVDHFKSINDSFGHLVGDRLLQILADRLRSQVRSCDLVARIGGDEFALLIPGASPTTARVAEIANRVGGHAEILGMRVRHSCSIGAAGWPNEGDHPEDVFAKADAALYRAKLARGAHPGSADPRACRRPTSSHH